MKLKIYVDVYNFSTTQKPMISVYSERIASITRKVDAKRYLVECEVPDPENIKVDGKVYADSVRPID